jgi:hypothetical protein
LARPQLVTIALLGWTFAQLIDFENGRVGWRGMCWLPPAFVLWTNLHGGALGGLCTAAFVFAGWGVCWLFGWPGPIKTAADLGRMALIGVACVLATFVNPYGWDLPLGWIGLMRLESLSKYIYEHMPLDWNNPYQRGIPIFGFVYIVALATVPIRRWRATWFVPILWFILTLQHIRHCTLFSITAAVALADVLPNSRLLLWAKRTEAAEQPNTDETPATRWLAWAIPALVVVLGLVLQAYSVPAPLIGAGQAQIDQALTPTELIDAIRQRSKPKDPIFNEMAYGGFLIYYLPELRVYFDDRCELYGDEFISQQMDLGGHFEQLKRDKKAPSLHEEFERNLDAQGIRLALVVKSRGYDYYFSSMPERWTRVGETQGRVSPAALPGAVLYERRQR